MFDLIESAKDLSVLFVGDTIIDEYQYVRPLGKSPKENVIPALALEREIFVGGTHAAARHARSFCKSVDVCSGDSRVRKVRMVDKNYLRKLYELHYVEPTDPAPAMKEADVTVVTDFGHGFITRDMIYELCERPFLAVNAQTNAANIGFNLITKYPRADYACIDEPEIRLALGERWRPVPELAETLGGRLGARAVSVTRGRHGALTCGPNGVRWEVPALSRRVVDRTGAGDAYLSLTAPCVAAGMPLEMVALLGGVAGALAVQVVGNRAPVEPAAVRQVVTALLA